MSNFNNPKGWANRISSRSASLKRISGSVRSLFSGDPVEVTEAAGAAITNPSLVEDILPAAVAESASTPTEAAQKAEAYFSMTEAQRNEVTVLPALVVSNALMVSSPNTRPVPGDNVNYNFNRCLTDYASKGYSFQAGVPTAKAGEPAPDTAVVEFTDANLYNAGLLPPDECFRYKTVPAFMFTLTASIFNTRPGAQYTLRVDGTTIGDIKIEGTDKIYTFKRLDYHTAVIGLYIPFSIIATRTVAALLKYGNPTGPVDNYPDQPSGLVYDATKDVSFKVTATGLASDERLIIEVPGYTMEMTSMFCGLYGLSAGKYTK